MSTTEVTPESKDANREEEANGAVGPPEPNVGTGVAMRGSGAGFTGPARIIAWDELTIFQRMIHVINELPAIGKTQRNREQGFMFRGHDDVMNALNPLLAKWGVFVVPDVLERETNTRQTSRGSTMYEVNLHVRFTFYGAAGDSFTASGWGEGTDMGDKATNKAMTGAMKYVIAQTFALATAETSDADSDHTSPEETTTGGSAGSGRPSRQTGRARQEEFDPGKHLLPGAIEVKSADDATMIRQGQRDLDPAQPWPDIEEYLAMHVFGAGLSELSRAQTGEYWKRLANAVVKVNELAGPGDFPPPTHEQIRTGYAWAFKDVSIALKAPEASQHDTPEDANQEAVEQAAAGEEATE